MSNKRIVQRHFVTFFSPGTFVSETTTKEIDSWDVGLATRMARSIRERYGATPYGFRFETRARGQEDLDSRVVKTSPMHYLGGKVLTLADVKREMAEERILISNMECNGIEKVVVNDNSFRSVHPMGRGDVVLPFEPVRGKR